MFEELRKRSVKKVLPLVVFLCLVGIPVLLFSANGFFAVLRGNRNFEELKPKEIESGMYVEAHIYGNFGVAIEETERREGSSYEKHVASYHVIWTGNETDMDCRYMMLKLPAKYDSQMTDMMEAYWDGEETDTLTFVGRIEKADEQELRYFYEYMEELGMTGQEVEAFTLPYLIRVSGAAESKVTASVFFFVGIALLLGGLLFMVTTVKGGRLKQLRKEIADIGYSEERVEADYARKREICEAPKLDAGEELVFFNVGAVSHVLKQREIVWVYYGATAQRVNGIKVATTYSLNLGMKNGKKYVLGVPSEKKAISAVELLKKRFPWAVAGYSDQLENLYQKNMPEFLELVYNRMPEEDWYAQTAAASEQSFCEEPLQ